MMILVFSVTLNWLPASGYASPFEDPVRSFLSTPCAMRNALTPLIA